MTKQLTFLTGAFSIVFVLSFFIHNAMISSNATTLTLSLFEVYVFFGIFSLALCVIFGSLLQKERFKDQLGFLYLGSVIIKMVLFSIIFYKHLFGIDSLSDAAMVNMLIPLFLSLFFEVFFLSKMLKFSPAIKNE